MDWGANAEAFLTVAVLGLSILLAVVSGVSYRRLRNSRALLISLGFLGFAGKGAFLVGAALQSRGTEPWITVVASFDLVILVLLYLSIRTR